MIEGILVGVEATERRIVVCQRLVAVRIHGSIMLVPKGQASAWLTLTVCFQTLPASRLGLVALELPLAARQAFQASVWA